MASNVELSEQQSKIVYAEEVPIYVKASAGSGKTRVLTERLRCLLGKTKKKVLALTFTNKAGEEIRERLSDIEGLNRRAFIGTFHSFCQSILENHGSSIGLPKMPHIFEDEADRLELIEQAISQTPSYTGYYKELGSKEKRNARYRVLSFVSKIKRNLVTELESFSEDEDQAILYQNYQDILRAQNAIDFDDVLLLAYKILIEHPKIAALYRRSYYAICVDEAQDLNYAQYQFVLALAGKQFANIMMVGDPNQSIYHFNGSSPDYMDKYFVEDFGPEIRSLHENYRSSVEVLRIAKSIFPKSEDIVDTVKKGIFEIHCLEDESEEALWVTDKIKSLIAQNKHEDIEGEITLEKIAVLARNKYIFSSVEEAFSANDLPFYYKMTSGSIKYESELMKIFDLSLRVQLNPLDVLHKKRLVDLIKSEFRHDMTLQELSTVVISDDHKRMIENVLSLKEDGSNLKTILEKYKDTIELNDENEKSMVFSDIKELLTNWYHYAKTTDNKSLHQFKNAMSLGKTSPLQDHKGITLSTVHTMKGQEYDIVFLIGMDDETFPDYRAVRSGGIDLKQEENNLYVALTRAKRFLYITWPQNRKMPWGDFKRRRKSRFLSNLS